ncbi:excinuclease ABC subunit UvrA [Suttonella ornithocola]|uniref:UvrABC system protein A n=1 Tax=Suttonella ornithocola TaxID=279832 RepID=A0A380MMA4_9GAMM|nr:excinuclease ABC subunit UvrA [Suttonella ornithocola]SUO93314.1 Excinuclease ABC subunit A [Suttonella ornithocola]
MDTISIRGARTHNLKNIDLDLPRDKMIVITGLSGSGKSSLAFDTIYAEGQRRYVESLSAYARQFLSMMDKPDVDHIEGLSPAISIEQKSTSHNPRSTVGTITEVHDYLRLLFARVGVPHCPHHGIALNAQTISQMVDQILALPEGSKMMLIAPLVQGRKGEHVELFKDIRQQGFVRVRIDGEIYEIDALPAIDGKRNHDIGVVVDRFVVKPGIEQRLAESLETVLELSDGIAQLISMSEEQPLERTFSAKYACPECGWSLKELEPRMFSFNNPHGACPECDGLGVNVFIDPQKVVAHPELSIAGGAVRGWDRRTPYFYPQMEALAAHYHFDLETPFGELPEKIKKIILYGSGKEKIVLPSIGRYGSKTARESTWEGVITSMNRRYHETDKSNVRDEIAQFLNNRECPSCHGGRLNEAARNVFIEDITLPEVNRLSIGDAEQWAKSLTLSGARGEIAAKILKEIQDRLGFLVNVGLNYLTLSRSAETLSGGEAQRIRLASQIGAGLVGVMYVLDEPSIGLHQRDNDRLLQSLLRLRDLGNTIIVVEHDEDAIRAADYVIDIGPGAGIHGGEIMAKGTPAQIAKAKDSLTGKYLSGREKIAIPETRTPFDKKQVIHLKGAHGHNLKHVDLTLPVGLFTCITGVSGSGKSTLINETFYKAVARQLNRATDDPAPFHSIDGLEQFDKVVNIDQSPIGRTPRSNPATYTGIFTGIRELFAGTQEARARGYQPGRFSFNVKGGRCEACQGDGVIKVEMHFLPDVFVACDVCGGKRYNRETLDITYKGKNIHEVLSMTVVEAYDFFENIPALKRKLQTLLDVGLSYISLGQNAVTLSGGEAQRIKLSRELSKRDTGRTLYVLDEPTTGLHFHDVKQLLQVLHRLRDGGNTVVVIEHNLDVIKTADWIIDLGPEGGSGGGEIIAVGTPEQVADNPASHTGKFLKPLLS